jgi:4-hydroxy-3-methylbut-2-enyl diphosphate reductase
MHLVEILEHHCPTYHIRDASEFDGTDKIRHFNQWNREIVQTENWIPSDVPELKIAITSGASCPDAMVDEVMLKLLTLFPGSAEVEEVLVTTLADDDSGQH